MKEENIIKQKSFDFAVQVVNLYKSIVGQHQEYVLSRQLLKSGTSIGANVCEAVFAQSRKDFVSKMNIALKESYETEYWLELLHRTEYISNKEYCSIMRDCKEINRILTSSIKTIKQNDDPQSIVNCES